MDIKEGGDWFNKEEEKINNHKKYSLFIGRWQPFHNGHKFIIDHALEQGKNVCIGIRKTELSEKNPFTVEQRKEMIKAVYGDNVEIIEIPDIESINIGRNVGYDIRQIETPPDVGEISGTEIRKGTTGKIPEQIYHYLKSLKTTIWFTGLPCSGKTTLGRLLIEELKKMGNNAVHLDGDILRKGLSEDLGFSEEDRTENLRRVAHVSKLFNDNGLWVVSSFITPTNKIRRAIRSIVGNIRLVYTKCDLEKCEQRDVKGMYARARIGEIKNFTGINDPFEEPEDAIIVDTENKTPEESLKELLEKLNL